MKNKPLYMQLYENLRREITEGVYPYGAKLPSKRVLADKTNMSVITVMHALDLLCMEGYTVSKQRSGVFVCYRQMTPKKALPIDAKIRSYPCVNVLPEDFPFSVYAKTMRRVISEYGEGILQKSPPFGLYELRRTISEYLARAKGMSVKADNILIGSGAEYLYGLIVQLFGKDAEFAIESPSYTQIENVYRAQGAKIVLLPLGDDGIDTRKLEKCDAKVLHITPYRSFPSGVTASVSKREEYIKWAEKHNAVIIEDDYESEFYIGSKPMDTVFSMLRSTEGIYINTFSKTVASSVRMAYMVMTDGLCKMLSDKLGFYSCTVPTFDQFVMAQFISNGDFERYINRMRRKSRRIP